MWWHADLPATTPVLANTPPGSDRGEPLLAPDGAFMLEWILPTLSADRSGRRSDGDGGERREFRRRLRDSA